MQESEEHKTLAIMVDYLFGEGVSSALPRGSLRFVRSRRSGRVKLVYHGEKLIATVKPGGAMALSLYGATVLARSRRFRESCVVVEDETAEFVRGGRSVFCKFVVAAGKNVLPRSEVAITDSSGEILGVGTAVVHGRFMKQFKSGIAVKVRGGRQG